MLAKMLPREVRVEMDDDDEPCTFESVEEVLAESGCHLYNPSPAAMVRVLRE